MPKLTKPVVVQKIASLLDKPDRLHAWIRQYLPLYTGPSVTGFEPLSGQRGCLVTIAGSNFSPDRWQNIVEVGGKAATVVAATPNQLQVITAPDVDDGPVEVTVGANAASGPVDFHVLGYPDAGAGEDGPPETFAGAGTASAGDVNPIGTIKVMVVLLQASDRSPPNATSVRNDVIAAWDKVKLYYKQASYDKTKVQYDVTASFKTLDGTFADFVDTSPSVQNIKNGQLDRLTAFAAQAAQDEGFTLSNYAMMACVLYTDTDFIRAWGGWSKQHFTYDDGRPSSDANHVHIDITLTQEINLLAIQHSANWGRFAHEFGHNIVSAPTFSGDGTATLGEDIYSSDLVDPNAASAEEFDLMGWHDDHPLFSGYHLDKLGYYDAGNIRQLTWDRNPFSQEFEVVAHGLAQDATANRFHLLKIKVTDGLHYYVQVRQRPGTTTQVFDDSIPLDGAPNQGGVVVTRAIADTLHVNQQTRFITLMHDPNVLKANDFVDDPARALRIMVVDDSVQARPQVCKVRVEWAQTVVNDPHGAFDLRVEPWDGNWQSPDIWVDRAPFGTFDNAKDAEGRPKGNGDKPKVGEVNQLTARVHVSGAMGASNVKVTFYAVFPPGVGDNGNWSPIGVQTISNLARNGSADVFANWVPIVGQHTCLKVYASQQLGEVSGGNNGAQENVFDFIAASHSPGTPALIRTAVRNPLDEPRMIRVSVDRVPRGWTVHFPHAWVWLDGKAERHFDLIVVPQGGYTEYQERKLPMTAPVRLKGFLPRSYTLPAPRPVGSRYYSIGGTLNNVHIRKAVTIDLREDREKTTGTTIALKGRIAPAAAGERIRVELRDPNGALRVAEAKTDAAGAYGVKFDLRYEPSLEADRKKWTKAEAIVPGIYTAQAEVFMSKAAADATSNLVYVQR